MYSWNMIFNILMVFDIKEKMDNFDPYVFLVLLQMLLMTAFLVQGHICLSIFKEIYNYLLFLLQCI